MTSHGLGFGFKRAYALPTKPTPNASLFVTTSYRCSQVLHQHEQVIRVLLKRHETVTLVERCSSRVLGVYEHSSPTDVVGRGRTACQRILQEITAKARALDRSIKPEAREENHGYWPLAGQPGTQPPRCHFGFNGVRSQGVEANDL